MWREPIARVSVQRTPPCVQSISFLDSSASQPGEHGASGRAGEVGAAQPVGDHGRNRRRCAAAQGGGGRRPMRGAEHGAATGGRPEFR
jgi:hypothetical protein